MTLMQEAKCGRVAPEIESAARREGLEPEKLALLVAAGRVVIPRNIRRERPGAMATGIGEMLTTKVNVNVGTSQSLDSPENEVDKARAAVAAGADAVMDLSTGGDLDLVRRKILRAVSVPVGTVPLYNAAVAKDLSPGILQCPGKARQRRCGLCHRPCGGQQEQPGAAGK